MTLFSISPRLKVLVKSIFLYFGWSDKKEFAPADVQSTLVALTAHSIANTIKDHQKMDHLYLCGGGVHNSYLVEYLQRLLPGLMVASTADAGVSPDYVEAMMFAWLGAKTINKKAVEDH